MQRRQFLRACLPLLGGSLLEPDSVLANEARRVRVLSYNMHHGEGTDGKIDLDRQAKVIRSISPDLVALQEVDRNTKRSGGVDQPKELGRLTEMSVVFERNITYQGGDYGNAVLSRLPIKRHQNHALPSHYKGEQRGVLEIEMEPAAGEPVLFFATHFDYRPDDAERQASAKFIAELLQKRPDTPAILAGDLNANPDSEVLQLFARTWRVAAGADKTFTYPAKEPTKQIDYVLFRPADRWKVIEVRVLDEPVASDHRPILAVLEMQ